MPDIHMGERHIMNLRLMKALANGNRLMVLEYLNRPHLYFTEEELADIHRRGLTNKDLTGKLRITQESTSLHMKWLVETGLINARRDGKFCYYTRNEQGIEKAIRNLVDILKAD